MIFPWTFFFCKKTYFAEGVILNQNCCEVVVSKDIYVTDKKQHLLMGVDYDELHIVPSVNNGNE